MSVFGVPTLWLKFISENVCFSSLESVKQKICDAMGISLRTMKGDASEGNSSGSERNTTLIFKLPANKRRKVASRVMCEQLNKNRYFSMAWFIWNINKIIATLYGIQVAYCRIIENCLLRRKEDQFALLYFLYIGLQLPICVRRDNRNKKAGFSTNKQEEDKASRFWSGTNYETLWNNI